MDVSDSLHLLWGKRAASPPSSSRTGPRALAGCGCRRNPNLGPDILWVGRGRPRRGPQIRLRGKGGRVLRGSFLVKADDSTVV